MATLVGINITGKTVGGEAGINNPAFGTKNKVSYSPAVEMAFDIKNICSPIRNDGINTYFEVMEPSGYDANARQYGHTTYYSSDTLSAISDSSKNLIPLTVLRRDEVRKVIYNSEVMLFDVNKFTGAIYPNTLGTVINYVEEGNSNVMQYVVSESVSSVLSLTTISSGGSFWPLAGTNVGSPATGPIEVSDNTTVLWNNSSNGFWAGIGDNSDLSSATEFAAIRFRKLSNHPFFSVESTDGSSFDSYTSISFNGVLFESGDISNSSNFFISVNGVMKITSNFSSFTGLEYDSSTESIVDSNKSGNSILSMNLNDERYAMLVIPTSSTGLPSGALWNNAGTLTIKP